MAINKSLLVAAPMLQNYLVNKDGTPLSGGIVTLWVDTARYTQLKNWYYQVSASVGYDYIPLENPLTLSAAGTIQDSNGNDVIPFYYPYDETNENNLQSYFITVYSVDENGDPDVLQFTRENFPFVPPSGPITTENPTLRNYILNNVYWRNIGNKNVTNDTDLVIAPSQHDGYTNGDIRFIKDVAGDNDSISFLPMTSVLVNDVTPETYLNVQCTTASAAASIKCIQYPISLHLATLKNHQATIVFHGQNVGGGANNYVDIQIYQFYGTGAVSPAPITKQRINLTSEFTKTTISFTFPDVTLTPGLGQDDAFFLRVQFPTLVNGAFNINHTKPQLYLSQPQDIPDNDFDTYDQIEAIINSPRTGDYKTSLGSFQPYGYVPANDGSIGTPTSSATSRANFDTWPLYNLLYTSILDQWCPVSGGRTAPGNTTTAAYTDFIANKRLTLTRNLGRVIAGLNPVLNSPIVFTVNFGVSNTTFNLAAGNTKILTTGTAIQFTTTGTLPTGLSLNTIYFVYNPTNSLTAVQIATTLEAAYAGAPLVTFSSNGTGTNSIVSALGIYEGETNHTLTIAEMPNHNHQAPTTGGSLAPGANGQYFMNGNIPFGSDTIVNVPPQGGGQPHNNIQPTMFANVFIKL